MSDSTPRIPRTSGQIYFELLVSVGLFVIPKTLISFYAYLTPAPSGPHQEGLTERVVYSLLQDALVILLVIHLGRLNGESLQVFTKPFRLSDLAAAAVLVIGGIAANWIVVLVLGSLAPEFYARTNRPGSMDFLKTLTAPMVLYMMVNPFSEEIVMRGFLQTRLQQAGLAARDVIVSSAFLQGLYHFYQGVPSMAGLTAMFLLFATYYAKSHRLWPPILAHLGLDACGLLSALLGGG